MADRAWIDTSLGEIAVEQNGLVDGPFGSALPASSYVPFGVPVIRGNNLSLGARRFHDKDFVYVAPKDAARLSRSICRCCDVIFTKKGTIGQTGIIPIHSQHEAYLLSSNQVKLTVDRQKVDPLFVYYYVTSPQSREKIIRDSSVTGVPKTNVAYLRSFPIHLPSLHEQRAIASILSSLDDKIDLNCRMNQSLEGIARTLFNAWFVDYDPVRAKAEGRETGMPKQIVDMFPDSLEDSEIGEVPSGWEVRRVDELANFNEQTLRKEDAIETIEYIEISEVSEGEIAHISCFDRGEEPSRARRKLRHGDTVLSTVRPDRKSYFLCLNPSPNLIASTGFVVVSPATAPWSWMHAALTREEVFSYLGRQADGGAYPAVRPEVLGSCQVCWPPRRELPELFHRLSAPFFEQAQRNRAESKILLALRDVLLPKLLSGELRIPSLAQRDRR